MRKVFKGEFVITAPPCKFIHKQLSLAKQKKDKEINKEREQLEQKRRQFQNVKQKWVKEQIEFKTFLQAKKEENARLMIQESKLKVDMFRLSIRRDQIESRTNPAITVAKARIVQKYLRSIFYTAGKKLQLTQRWGGYRKSQNLKHLWRTAVDRFFGWSQTQRTIVGNLSRIVFFKKFKLKAQLKEHPKQYIVEPQEQQAIICIKSCKNSRFFRDRTGFKQGTDDYNQKQQQLTYELQIYTITGKYLCFTKEYREDQLRRWADAASKVQFTKVGKVTNQPRLSVADNLAKINALKTLGYEMTNFKLNRQNTSSEQFKMISEEVMSSPGSEINQTDEESFLQRPQQKKTTTQNQSEENLSQANSETESAIVRAVTAEKMKTNELLLMREVKTNAKFRTRKQVKSNTRKQMTQKSSFFISKNQSQTCRFNRQFLMGLEEMLFPAINPALNVIVLIKRNQIYLLQDYLQAVNSRRIIEQAVCRFRIKRKVLAEIKKYLYFKKQTITACYQTCMAKLQSISLPCFFALKTQQSPDKVEIYITCDSIVSHPTITNGLRIKSLLHTCQKQKEEVREEKETRSSNNKNIKNSISRKSRDSKLRSQIKHHSRGNSIHQKSGFVQKKARQVWIAFSLQTISKYQSFVANHFVCITSNMFVTRKSVQSVIRSCIKIQNRMRWFLSKKLIKRAKQTKKIKCVSIFNLRILITAVLQASTKKFTLCFESIKQGSYFKQSYEYDPIDWQVVCGCLSSTKGQGSFQDTKNSLIDVISRRIAIQAKRRERLEKQKPQRYRRMVQSFLFMVGLRNRARKNIFFLRKEVIRDRIFVLLIRRNKFVRSLLQCNLYDLISQKKIDHELSNIENAFSQQQKDGSDYGSNKARSKWKPQFDNKIYRYQKIYLMQQYFNKIDYKSIWDEFYIEKGVFLLKPPKVQNIYYIQRLATLDLNSQQFYKELTNYQKQESLFKPHQNPIQYHLLQSFSKTAKINPSQFTEKTNTQSKQAFVVPKSKQRNQSKMKKEKKTSIEQNKKQIVFLKSQFQKQNLRNSQMVSKRSFGESNSCKIGRQILQIKHNSHESIVYYSLYKEDSIFFYLQLFIVSKTYHEGGYCEELVTIAKERLQKKLLEESTSSLLYMKLAAWAHENEDQFIKIQETVKDKNEDNMSKKQGSASNLVTLEFFNALMGGSKRFSFQNSIISQKGPRTNTLIL